MLSSWFVNPAFMAGAALIAAPIIIHLLHRLNFRRVSWAAMEFLLDSQRRNRRRIFFEQFLLLLLRCLLILGVVVLLARPLAGERLWSLIAAGQRSEHVIVIDDSFSMGQRLGTTTGFGEGLRMTRLLLTGLADQPGKQFVTILRTSQRNEPEIAGAPLDRPLVDRFGQLSESWEPSDLATPPGDGVAQAASLLAANDASQRSVYLVSDYRAKDWGEEGDLVKSLRKLSENQTELYLLDVASQASPNLTVERLSASLGSAAAELPFDVAVEVHNDGPDAVERVRVHPRLNDSPLPAQTIERIESGQSARVTFPVRANEIGRHRLQVSLEEDALATDNKRWLAFDLEPSIPVLIVAGDARRLGARFLSFALAPGGGVNTGLVATIHGPEFPTGVDLAEFRAVYLVNVPQLDGKASEAIVDFVKDGGGLGIFLGEQISVDSYNAQLAAEGGFLPAALGPVRDVSDENELGVGLAWQSHPVFRVFEGERNPFLDAVRFQRYFTLSDEEAARDEESIVASTSEGDPLVVESTLGRGRVMLFLSTVEPSWNTWARNPSFVVAMLELQRHLATPAIEGPEARVGVPWQVDLDTALYRPAATFTIPSRGDGAARTLEVDAERTGLAATVTLDQTEVAGIYRLTRTRTDGSEEIVAKAINVDPAEGKLAKLTAEARRELLQGIEHHYFLPSDFRADADEGAFEPRDVILLILVLMLFFEQWLAYRLSYHLK
ncbi:hypothetical protein Pan216_40860 [Planctomycetes bacterium Pan216]|uniref:Aerotolerance regulator N-terminal domain-containing protein n=1 Tax=Kolteria novifilia TaxID=2527975 RepID=A0A518B8A5_9BACT|nr:hypothetical protein Pan216_40860 [Planctomycetes bacterium Pan216]